MTERETSICLRFLYQGPSLCFFFNYYYYFQYHIVLVRVVQLDVRPSVGPCLLRKSRQIIIKRSFLPGRAKVNRENSRTMGMRLEYPLQLLQHAQLQTMNESNLLILSLFQTVLKWLNNGLKYVFVGELFRVDKNEVLKVCFK